MAALHSLVGALTHPVLVGPLLWLGTIAPDEYRLQAIGFLVEKGVPSHYIPTGLTVLKVLFAYGVARQLNNALNYLSYRNFRAFGQPKTAWNWPSETAVVTGGSGDIATHVVRNLVKKGLKVAILDIRPPVADVLALPGVKFYQCDLTSQQAVADVGTAVVADLGVPTVLINNAGIGTVGSILQMQQPELERVFKVNVLHHYYTTQAFLPGMIRAGKGHILTVASMASYVAVPGISHYCASKAAALSYHDCLTQELQHRLHAPFISTTCVHPIWVQGALTDPIAKSLKKAGDSLISQEHVAKDITDAIFSGHGGHFTIPKNDPRLGFATFLRAAPSWLTNVGFSTLKGQTASMEAAQAERYAKSRAIGMEMPGDRY